jgi:AraC family transcriptional regulator of adaptative response/methylated-DNA-[protein]-cysteine methyltransferase
MAAPNSKDETMLDTDLFWEAIDNRNSGYDGVIYCAVKTTGIYCKPSCPAPSPKRGNVTFYSCREQAEAAGFRPCKRCLPDREDAVDPDVAVVMAARDAMDAEPTPSVARVADTVGIDGRQMRKLFHRVLGVSPKQFSSALRAERLKRELRSGTRVTDAIYDAGYSGPSRVYEKSATELGMTPATYARGGAGAHIEFSITQTALGWLLVAGTKRGLCCVRFGESREALEAMVVEEFPAADRVQADNFAWSTAITDYLDGGGWPDLPTDVHATAFQARVWHVLRNIPAGKTLTYGEVAACIGQPKASRAVARACASNPVALAVPCHRVVRAGGGAGGYRWGGERKQALLDLEADG